MGRFEFFIVVGDILDDRLPEKISMTAPSALGKENITLQAICRSKCISQKWTETVMAFPYKMGIFHS